MTRYDDDDDDDDGDVKNDTGDNTSSKAFSQCYTGQLLAVFTLNLQVAYSSALFVSARQATGCRIPEDHGTHLSKAL